MVSKIISSVDRIKRKCNFLSRGIILWLELPRPENPALVRFPGGEIMVYDAAEI